MIKISDIVINKAIIYPTELHREYLEYVSDFSEKNNVSFLLKGSLAKGTAGIYSDVDLVMLCEDDNIINKFIQGYGDMAYLGKTENPKGILILIYENGISVDLDIRRKIEREEYEKGIFLGTDFSFNCIGEQRERYENYPLQQSDWERTARLFHRSLIKYLGGKQEVGQSVLNEIFQFVRERKVTVLELSGAYKLDMKMLFEKYQINYDFGEKYKRILETLIGKI